MEHSSDQIIEAWEDEVALGKEIGLKRDFINHVSISLVNDTLSLIKELIQTNEMLSESYEHLEKTKDELIAERSRLTDENEKLRAEKEVLEITEKDLRFRNKELQRCNEGLAKNIEELEIEGDKVRERLINESRYTNELIETMHKVHEEKVQKTIADTVRKMQNDLYVEFLYLARCQKDGEPNMTSQEVFYTLDRVTKRHLDVSGNDNLCVSCGKIIPEGRQVCPLCECKRSDEGR